MFTVFDLLRLLAIVGGTISLGIVGWNTLGSLGLIFWGSCRIHTRGDRRTIAAHRRLEMDVSAI
jgi:hypothetical protein